MSFPHHMPTNTVFIKVRKAIKPHICGICKKDISKNERYVVISLFLIGYNFKETKTCLKHSRLDIKNLILNSTKKHLRSLVEMIFKTSIMTVNKLQVNREIANRLSKGK